MGATQIAIQSKGKSMRDAYNNAIEEAIYMYGRDPYNGEINNCDLGRDITDKYNLAEDKEKFIDEMYNEVDKREVFGIYLNDDDYLFIGWAPC